MILRNNAGQLSDVTVEFGGGLLVQIASCEFKTQCSVQCDAVGVGGLVWSGSSSCAAGDCYGGASRDDAAGRAEQGAPRRCALSGVEIHEGWSFRVHAENSLVVRALVFQFAR